MKDWIPFQFLLKNPYQSISKGSVVTIQDEKFVVSRIERIVLLDNAVNEPNAVQVFARGYKKVSEA